MYKNCPHGLWMNTMSVTICCWITLLSFLVLKTVDNFSMKLINEFSYHCADKEVSYEIRGS